jgi:DNA-binding response OmpR family regulator
VRALVVDDQREFFDSIRPILKKAGFVCAYAPDLSSAETAFSNAVFDMVLTDLQMPPGNWGGLDVIRMVRERDTVVPVFAVSGKGTLAECIQALRLKANDYIRKELFASEFVERVMPLFARPYAIDHFPSLIAYLFRLYEEEQQEYAKARRLLDVFENTVRLLALMTIAEQFPKERGTMPAFLERLGMDRPSLGSYVAFLFEALKGQWEGYLLAALRASDLGRLREDCDEITKCRNEEFAHSSVIPSHRAIEITQRFSSVLVRLLNAISFLRRFQLFVAQTLRFDGELFTASGKLLQGSNLHHPTATVALNVAVPTGHSVVILDATVVTDVSELLEVIAARKGNWDVYKIYSKVAKNGLEFDLTPK